MTKIISILAVTVLSGCVSTQTSDSGTAGAEGHDSRTVAGVRSLGPEPAPRASSLNLQIEGQITRLISQMTLAEKVSLVRGNDPQTNEIKRLGIPSITMNDGPIGLRLGPQTAFPAGVALGATFDPRLAGQMGEAIADEARLKNVNMMLGPCVNIHRTPFGGRNAESYGEDPFLASQLVKPFISEMQKRGVIATVKHFAVNDEEWHRHTMDVEVDERTLQEIHLPAFKAAVDAGTWSVMSAYNLVNGQHASESDYLLDTTLKKNWGFSGFVVSDWSGTVSTVAQANAGLDLEMPTGTYYAKLAQAVDSGLVKESTVDDKVRRILRAMFSMGLMDSSMQSSLPPAKGPQTRAHRQLAQKIAEESIVLLKNDDILPLSRSVKSIAVIGPSASTLRTGVAGSSQVSPFEAVSPLDALRSKLGDKVKINFAPGTQIEGDLWPSIEAKYFPEGVKTQFFKRTDLQGASFLTRRASTIDMELPHTVDDDVFGVRWTAKLVAPVTGRYKLSTTSFHATRVYLDGRLIIQTKQLDDDPIKQGTVYLRAGQTYALRIDSSHNDDDNGMGFQFGWDIPNPHRMADAIEAAKKSDVALLFVGLTGRLEGEGLDREKLTLPDDQVALIQAVARANPNVVVIMNSGSVSLMRPWLARVKGVLQAWYPGEEGGQALARLLTGEVSPSGKLPESSLKRWEDSSAYENYPGDPKTQVAKYAEGVFVGYRYLDSRNIAPEFPFGFGLSYTTFKIDNLQVTASNLKATSPAVEVQVDVTNTGSRDGDEVVQAYVGEKNPSVRRPPRELKGFARLSLRAGETRTITMKLDKSAFAFWDVATHDWKVNPHVFTISVGSSSRDLPVSREIQLR